MNNSHGVFSVYEAKREAEELYAVQNNNYLIAREVHLPKLYDNLKKLGINILSVRDLELISKLSKTEKDLYFKNYRRMNNND